MADAALSLKMRQMIHGYWITQSIHTAAKIKLADTLVDGPMSVSDLAEKLECNEDFLYRLLRALASIEIFTEVEDRVFGLTPLAELLVSDQPDSLYPSAMLCGDEHYFAWGKLSDVIKTGKNAFEEHFGMNVFEFLSFYPAKARVFDAAMTSYHINEAKATLKAYDFSQFKVLADVGGGNGTNLISILEAIPDLTGILYDLPHVVDRAAKIIEESGVEDRLERIAGDFFEAVVPGADAIFMRHIVHDWNDEKATQILKNCHAALPDDGKLVLAESVLAPGNEKDFAKFLDLTMMLLPGGKERTESEYRELLANAGFALTQVIETEGTLDVIEAVKV